MVSSSFASADELRSYVNSSLFELYDLVVNQHEDWFLNSVQFTLTGSQSTYTVSGSTSFQKLRGVELSLGGQWQDVRRFNFAERNKYQAPWGVTLPGVVTRRYRLQGNTIQILPANSATGTYQVWFVPLLSPLVNDGDAIPTVLEQDGWYEYITCDVAIKLLQKEESDVSVLMGQKMALVQRINASSANRDAAEPEVIAQVESCWDPWSWRGGW